MRGAIRETIVAAIDKKQVQSFGRRAPNRTNLGDKQLRRQPITAPTRGRITGRDMDLRQATIREFGPEVRITGRDKKEISLEEKERLKKLTLTPAQALNPVAVVTLGQRLRLELDDAKDDMERGDIIKDLVLPAIDTLQQTEQTILAVQMIHQLGYNINRQSYPSLLQSQSDPPNTPDRHTITGKAEWDRYGSKVLLFLGLMTISNGHADPDRSPLRSTAPRAPNSPPKYVKWTSLITGVAGGGTINLRDMTYTARQSAPASP
jgi:hypothetical protein